MDFVQKQSGFRTDSQIIPLLTLQADSNTFFFTFLLVPLFFFFSLSLTVLSREFEI